MPVCLRTDKHFKFSLDGDKHISAAHRPHFLCRFVSVAERDELREQIESLDQSAPDFQTKRSDLIRQVVTGVANMGELTIAQLLEVKGDQSLTNGERWELLWGALNEQQMSEDDLKNSVSP